MYQKSNFESSKFDYLSINDYLTTIDKDPGKDFFQDIFFLFYNHAENTN